MKKLTEEQINELYSYANNLTLEECGTMPKDKFLIYIEKSYKVYNDSNEEIELFDYIKRSIDKVTNIFKSKN